MTTDASATSVTDALYLEIADAIMSDIDGRSGMDMDFDEEVMEEIRTDFANIIRTHIERTRTAARVERWPVCEGHHDIGNPCPGPSSAGNTAEAVAFQQTSMSYGKCSVGPTVFGYTIEGDEWSGDTTLVRRYPTKNYTIPLYTHPAQDGAASYREPTLDEALKARDVYITEWSKLMPTAAESMLKGLKAIGAVVPIDRNEQEAGG